MKEFFTPIRFSILSQLFVNLSAGWFGVVLIIPGVARLDRLGDIAWLTKNVLLGILALVVSLKLAEKGQK